MNTPIVINPVDSLIETVALQLDTSERDLSNYAVIFPGKRPAHFLRKEIALRISGSFLPPKIFSIDDFIKSLFQSFISEKFKDIEPIDAVTLLYQVHRELKEKLGGDYFTSFDSFIPIGLKLFAELEELKLANIPEQNIKDIISQLSYNRLYSLAEYYRKFYLIVEDGKYLTRSLRYAKVAEQIENINLEKYKKVIIAGLYKLTNTEKIIYEKLSKLSNVYFIYQTDKIGDDVGAPEYHFINAPDTHGQVFALSAIIKKEIEEKGRIDEHSVVVLSTSDALFPLVNHTLSILKPENYNIALGYPISRTPLYGFINSLMELLCSRQGEGYSASHYIKFLLHPYTKNIRYGSRSDVTRILFHAIESNLIKDSSQIQVALEGIEDLDELFTNVAFAVSKETDGIHPNELKEHLKEIHNKTIRIFENVNNLGDYARKNIEVLSYLYDHSTANLHPLFRPYAEAILEVFAQLDNSLIGEMSLDNIEGYFNFLKQYIESQNVPFTGTPLRGLQVLGLLETRGLKFDNVYLINANDDVLPGRGGSDMLLPQKLRESLGLETNSDRDELSEHYFNLLVRGAKQVHFFFEESDKHSKSRFIERILWEKQKTDKSHCYDNYIANVRYKVKLTSDNVEPIPKTNKIIEILNGFTFSSSALDTYLQCQIRFFYRYILHLKEKEEIGDDIDSREIGLFIHEALSNFYRPFIGRKIEYQDLDTKRMEILVDDLFAKKFGEAPAGALFLSKRQIKKQLNIMLTNYQKRILDKGDIIVKSIEDDIDVEAFQVKFSGRIDRIEQRGDHLYILDYKTGVMPSKPDINFKKFDINERASWSDAITSVQLPVYLLMYNIKTGIPIEQIIPAYLYLGENNLGIESEYKFFEDGNERAEVFNKIKELIEKLICEIRNPGSDFIPPDDLNKTCKTCPFITLCGTNWIK